MIVDDEPHSWPANLPPRLRYLLLLGVRPLAVLALAAVGAMAGRLVGVGVGVAVLALALTLCAVALRRPLLDLAHPRRPVLVTSAGSATGSFVLARAAVLAAAVMIVTPGTGGLVAAVGVLAALALEQVARELSTRAYPYVAHLPGARPRNWPAVNPSLGFAVTLVALGAMLAATLSRPWWPLALVTALCAVATNVGIDLDALRRIRARQRFEADARALVTRQAPVFVLHWDAPEGTAYQVAMWLPYLERLNLPFVVVLREEHNFADVVPLTSAPVLVLKSLDHLDQVVVDSLKAAVYVNTASVNSHLVRYARILHIQLNHGESDKEPSFNRVMRMFDKNLVAGKAAIDRFAEHGVEMPASMFEIVGRPQVEGVEPAGLRPAGTTVMYAPTWQGHHADSNYSSLASGPAIVRALLDRGLTVVFRPHPYSRRALESSRWCDEVDALLRADAGRTRRPHVFGTAAEQERTVFECFNVSDALITDVSSLVGDYLASRKPFAMVSRTLPATQFRAAFPVARAAYVISAHDLDPSLIPALDDMLGADPLAQTRAELAGYYLGSGSPQDAAVRFSRTMLRLLSPPESADVARHPPRSRP